MMKSTPEISVLMSVCDEEKYVSKSIESILNQSFSDFEFIITDDHSSDGTLKILNEYASKDLRIKIIEHQEKKGLASSLNEQIQISHGNYLARMDGDDIAHPERFSEQVKFLEDNYDIGMAGSFCREIDEDGRFIALWTRPTSNEAIKKMIFHFNPFIHSSIMIRRDVFTTVGLYDTKFKYAQDFDLWLRVSKDYKLANIPKPLIDLRVDWNKLEYKNKEARKNRLKILCRHIRLMNYPKWYYIYLIYPFLLYILPTSFMMILKNIQRNMRISQNINGKEFN